MTHYFPVLPSVFGEQFEEFVMVHVLQGGEVDAQGVGNGGQIQSKLKEQVDEVHLVAGERVAEGRAGEVALRPRASVEAAVAARVGVLLDVVYVVNVELQRRTTVTYLRRQRRACTTRRHQSISQSISRVFLECSK